MKNEKKKRIPLWIYPSTEEKVKQLYESDNCKSASEFIENAIIFYGGFLSAEENKKYLPNAIISSMRGIVQDSESRIARVIFKLSVEMAMIMNVLAAKEDVDEITLARLRARCADEVKKINGTIKFDDTVKFQRGYD